VLSNGSPKKANNKFLGEIGDTYFFIGEIEVDESQLSIPIV